MLKSIITTALRSLGRNRLHAFINIVGLAIGMTCCILIALFVQYELGYDKQNKRADRIYRMAIDLEANSWAISAFPIGSLLKDNFAEVETYTRIKPSDIYVQNPNNLIKNKEKVFFADSSVFDVLDIQLLKGDPTTALANINSMVITEEKAKTYFGDEDPIGKTLTLLNDKTSYQITGVFKPMPSNAHVHMGMMVSSLNFGPMKPNSPNGWSYLTNHYTYLVLPENFDYQSFEKKISKFLDEYNKLQPGEAPNVLRLQPLTSIHLHSNLGLEVESNGNLNTVYIMSAIAFFILIIACINFMNLTTAQSLKRAREVGMRKAVGSSKQQLIFQFIGESVLMSFLSLIVAIGLLSIAIPTFNKLSGKLLIINPMENNLVSVMFLSITLFVGLVSGIYPAFFLSAFKPVQVLKGNFIANVKGQLLRKGLVVFQFAVAFIIMVGTYVVYSQLEYMQNKNLGFDRSQTMVLRLPQDSINDAMVKEEMKKLSMVQNVTRMLEVPGKMVRTTMVWYEGVPENKAQNMYIFSGDADLLEAMGMELKAGKYFDKNTQRFYKEFLINEAALKKFGWKEEEAIGKLMDFGERGEDPGKVIGIIKDFHYKHLHDEIGPLAMYLEPHYEGQLMALKLKPGKVTESVAAVEANWKKLVPAYELEYSFLDESFNQLFEQEKRLSQLFAIFSGLAIFISCLGLFGLASFTLEQSRKSVAVRKVLGASVPGIVMMMSKDFLKLVCLGMIIASPLAYWATNKWLQGFAYNMGFAWVVFLYAAVVAVLIAFLTVSYHSVRAATSNPVDALKGE